MSGAETGQPSADRATGDTTGSGARDAISGVYIRVAGGGIRAISIQGEGTRQGRHQILQDNQS
jgi:hypothetical protein